MENNRHESDEITLAAHGSERGNLYVGEVHKQLPFDIKRFYIIANIPKGALRAEHAHKEQEQALFCLKGSCEISFDDGRRKWTTVLNSAGKGVRIRKKVWHTISNVTEDVVLLVVASGLYDESDYLRDYKAFLAFIR